MKVQAVIATKFGNFEITGSEKGISRVQKVADERTISDKIPATLQSCAAQLQDYFDGKLKEFDLKLDFSGTTDFNQKVWQVLLSVPYGHTISYGAIAEQIGSPKAYQAVGLANKHNPIAIIVPCHRCIGKDGNLTGYFYGLDVKRALLQLENPMSFAVQGKLF